MMYINIEQFREVFIMLKKIIACFLCCTLLLGVIATSALAFDDVTEKSHAWAVSQINEMTEKKIINGFEDGTFRPDQSVTRIDSLLLISRILGITDASQKKIVEFAKDEFFSSVESLKYPNYTDNLSYILYKEMFSPEDLTTFLKNGLGAQALKRYEAAVLMVKMAGESDNVAKMKSVELPFADADKIPAVAKPYVFYCYKNGLMKGVEDNKFDPLGTLTRAQMAVLLYNCMNVLDLSISSGTVTKVSGFENLIKYIAEDDKVYEFINTGDIRITLNGQDISDIDAITSGDKINIHYSADDIILIEAMTVLEDEVIEGVYVGRGTSSAFSKILIRPKTSSSKDDASDYILAENVKIFLDGKEITISDLKADDLLKLTIDDSRVSRIDIAKRESSVTGYISDFNYEGQGSLEVKLTDNTVAVYKFTTDNVKVTRNNATATLRDLKVGDKVTVSLKYNEVVSVAATSEKKTYKGTIEEILISRTTPKIKIDIGSEVIECAMDDSISITFNGKDATVYDLQLGFTANVKTDSASITQIEITSAPSADSLNVVGTVLEINTNYSSLTLKTGEGKTVQLFVKNKANIINGTTGRTMALSAIKPGDMVTAVVSTTNFSSEAISIVVLEKK